MKKIILLFAAACVALFAVSCGKTESGDSDGGVPGKYSGATILGTWTQVGEGYHASVVELKADGTYSWTIAPIPMIRSTGTYEYDGTEILFAEKATWNKEKADGTPSDVWIKMGTSDNGNWGHFACRKVVIKQSAPGFMIWEFDENAYMGSGDQMMVNDEPCKVKASDLVGTWECADETSKDINIFNADGTFENYYGWYAESITVGETTGPGWVSSKRTGTWEVSSSGLTMYQYEYYSSEKSLGYNPATGMNEYERSYVNPETLVADEWLYHVSSPYDDTSRIFLVDGKLYIINKIFTKKN